MPHAIEALPALAPVTLPAAYALAARAFAVPIEAALTAYVWSWLENQVLAAIKLVPLGQVAGQRLLIALGEKLAAGRGDGDVDRRRRPVDIRARACSRERSARDAVLAAVPVLIQARRRPRSLAPGVTDLDRGSHAISRPGLRLP